MARLPLRVFPVRHHSPLAARMLERVMRDDPPAHLLVEGPADASGYIPDLVSPGTEPPVSLLYFIRGRPSACYPFASFSPEYRALKVAHELGVDARFCDMPLRLRSSQPDPAPAPEDAGPVCIRRSPLDVQWETELELAAPDISAYMEGALRLGGAALPASAVDRAREAYMYKVAENLVAGGADPSRILVVCGAAHAPALAAGAVDLTLLEGLESQGDAEIYLVPYSFRRFSDVLGNGAGTSYPHFYQALWDAGGCVEDAVCRMLTEIARDLCAKGHDASVADAIDALLFARHLAALRRKPAPGPEEIVQAVESCLTRGHYGRAAEAVVERLVGDRMGCVTPSADKAPLAREFYAFINHPRRGELLPLTDLPATRSLELGRPLHREVSRFLHRLLLIDIPYADHDDPLARVVQAIGLAQRAAPPSGSSLVARGMRHPAEVWSLRWRPSLDGALTEASGHGGTIAEVALRSAEQKLRALTTLLEAAALYLEVDRADLERMVLPCLQRVEELARQCTDFTGLVATACEVVNALRHGAGLASPERTRALAAVLVQRTVFLFSKWPRVPESLVWQVAASLEQLASLREHLDPALASRVGRLLAEAARSRQLQPDLAGIAAAIAFRHQVLSPVAVVAELMDRLVGSDALVEGAAYLHGLVSHAREALLSSTAATDALRDFVLRLPEARFVLLLPIMRKGFQLSSNAEIRYFMAVLAGPPGETARPPPSVTRRVNRRVEAGAYAGLEEWMRHAASA